MSYTERDLARILANPDITLVTDGEYTTPMPKAAFDLVQASINSEHDLQREVIAECERRAAHDDRWADIYAIPNGQFREGQRMEPGLKSGVPDLFLAVPSGPYHGLYIELKWKDNKPKRNQLDWMRRLRQRGYKVLVCWDEVAPVINAIKDYLEEA